MIKKREELNDEKRKLAKEREEIRDHSANLSNNLRRTEADYEKLLSKNQVMKPNGDSIG